MRVPTSALLCKMYKDLGDMNMECGHGFESLQHRRRLKTEEKAKVLAAVWGEEFIQFLAALAVLSGMILNNRMNSSFSFKSSWCNSSYEKRRPLTFLLAVSLFYALQGP